MRRLSSCNAVAYARRRKSSRSVSNAYSALSLSSRRWCSSRSCSRRDSFCETSPTRASSLRMSDVSPEISCVSCASCWRVAESFACTSPSEWWPLSAAAGEATSRQPMARIAKRRAMAEDSAGRRTSLPEALAVPSLRALGPRLGDDGRAWLGDDGRVRRVALVGRRIRLGDDGRPDRILFAGRRRLLWDLHHLRRLHLQPAAADPVLRLRVHCLHLGLLLPPLLIERNKALTGTFGRLLVATVHRISELEQETSPQNGEFSELAPQSQGAGGGPAARRDRVCCDTGAVTEDAGLDAQEHKQKGEAEQDQPNGPVADREEDDCCDESGDGQRKRERRGRHAVVAPLGVRDGDRHGTCLVGR